MNNFVYFNPVKVIFEENAFTSAAKSIAMLGKTAMIVSYENVSFFKDKLDELCAALDAEGVRHIEFFRVVANPLVETAREGVALCKKEQVEVVVGFGGGSVMDTAKVIAAGTVYPHGDILNMFVLSVSDPQHIQPESSLPTVMIPTLPATGSEMNQCAVMTNGETRQKSYVWSDYIFPKIAVMDPSLTIGLPAYQTACGGIDTIAHITEAYLNGNDSNLIIQDNMELGVIRAVMETLPVVLKEPGNLQARGVMMWAASIALSGWINSGTMVFTPMHQLGHVLSAQYNATHGATLACMMPAWMRFFAKKDCKSNRRYRMFAQALFGCGIEEAADKFEAWMADKGVQTRISQFGVTESEIAFLASEVKKASFTAEGVLGSYPTVNEQEIAEIYRLAL